MAEGKKKKKKPMVVQIRNPGVRRSVLRLRLYGGPGLPGGKKGGGRVRQPE